MDTREASTVGSASFRFSRFWRCGREPAASVRASPNRCLCPQNRSRQGEARPIQAILRTTDRSLVEGVRLALEAEGIGVVLDQELSAIPFIPVTVFVAEPDVDHARQVLRDLSLR